MASLNIVVDKMHIKGHVDPWCLENCDARKVNELEKVLKQRLNKNSILLLLLHSVIIEGGYTDL